MKIQAKNLVVMAALVLIGSLAVSATTYYVLTKNFEKERETYNEELYNIRIQRQK
jgi:hypothetical protein